MRKIISSVISAILLTSLVSGVVAKESKTSYEVTFQAEEINDLSTLFIRAKNNITDYKSTPSAEAKLQTDGGVEKRHNV